MALLRNVLRSLAVLLVVTFVTFCLMFRNGPASPSRCSGCPRRRRASRRRWPSWGSTGRCSSSTGTGCQARSPATSARSFYTAESVTGALANRVPVTLTVVILTLLLTAILSVLLGVVAAVRGGATDRVVQVVSILGAAIPAFIVAIVLVFTFAIAWRVFPATGYVRRTRACPAGWRR